MNDNEITLRATVDKPTLVQTLLQKDFQAGDSFSLDDHYFVPHQLDLTHTPIRDILAHALIIRDKFHNHHRTYAVIHKHKVFSPNGDIIQQSSITCDVHDPTSAKQLLESIGYIEIMNIKENDTIYRSNQIEIALKDVTNGDLLLEVDGAFNNLSIEELKALISNLELPVEPNQFFIKKAEDELAKLLQHN